MGPAKAVVAVVAAGRISNSLVPSRLPGLTALSGGPSDYDEVIRRIGSARFVLLGEASHGTHEFYRERARLTRRLIEELGFTAVAIEGDWPDTYRLGRHVLGESLDRSAREALSDFMRFPSWMWRNEDVADFAEWLRLHNDEVRSPRGKVSIYGLDLYSMQTSMAAVVAYLDGIDPEASREARRRYGCFDHVSDGGSPGQAYGRSVAMDLNLPCEGQVVAQLEAMRSMRADIIARDGWTLEDKQFHALQNARLVRNAERYYREMYRGRASSWNLRDLHMAETLQELAGHLDRHVGRSKIVVWAHNSHVGDARATQMGERGELNIGQVARSRWGADVVNVGFTTYDGTVTAADNWDDPEETMAVRPALPGSYEALFHDLHLGDAVLDLSRATWLPEEQLERAIGVIYRPTTERASHYFHTRLHDQFDVVIHIDRTRAVRPLDDNEIHDPFEPAETYPTGL